MDYSKYAHVYNFLNQANSVEELNRLVGDAIRLGNSNPNWPNEAVQYYRKKIEQKFDYNNPMKGPSAINSRGIYRPANNTNSRLQNNVITYQTLDSFLDNLNKRSGGCRTCGR